MKKFGMGLAGLLAACALTAPAQADILWLLNGTFDDGTTVSGSFTINYSGYISAGSLTTQANGPFAAGTYAIPIPSGAVYSGANSIEFQPYYQNDLRLIFSVDIRALGVGETGTGAIVGASYECQASFSCFDPSSLPTDYPIRRITSGTISGTQFGQAQDLIPDVPEPASWALMIGGFGMVGAALRRRRKAALPTY